MLKVGLTGGIGCGKSTVAKAFVKRGIPVIDADEISKSLVEPGKPALQEIAEYFGSDVIQADGSLDRAVLKKYVFDDAVALEKLESILHPEIRRQILQRMAQESNAPYVVVDIPLLVEKNYQSLFDRIIVVDCLPQQQIQRVSKRDNLSPDVISKIMQTQANREERLEISTYKLDNTGSLDSLDRQIELLHLQLL
jgi:dephospho-CoA kinase